MSPPSDRADANTAAAPARWRRRSRIALALALLLWLVLIVPPLALWVTARSEAGTRWLLAQVPGLSTGTIRGALLDERFSVDTLQWQGGPQQPTLRIEQLELVRPQWRVLPNAGAWLGLSLDGLKAARIVWRSAAEPAAAGAPPTQLRLPFALGVQQAQIGALEVDERRVASALRARLQLSGRDGAEHRVDDLSLRAERALLQGQARIEADAPMTTALELRAAPADDAATPWQASVRASGPLARLDVQASLRGQAAAAGRAAPTLDIQARIEPFAAWPIAALELSTRELDLAALSDAAPQTRIDARARVDTSGLDRPVHASVQLDNHAPGRLDARRLPLRRLQLELAGTPSQPDRITIERLDADLADEKSSAGRVRGSGRWHGTTLALQLQAQSLQPARIDSRAGPMELSGPLTFELQGLAVPTAPRPDPLPPWQAHIDADLSGAIGPRRNPVRAEFDARLRAGVVDVTRLLARSGEARLEARVKLQRSGGAAAGRGWQVEGAGEISRFDPLPWWPGSAGSAWARGPHRFDGRWQLDVLLPDGIDEQLRRNAAAALASLRGSARVDLGDSLLAGVPLSGLAQARADAAGVNLELRARAAANQVEVDGRWARTPAEDRWRVRASAPALAALQPLLGLLPADAAAPWNGLRGDLRVQAQASGRWPALATQGELQLRELHWQRSRVASGEARWQIEPGDGGALNLQATLSAWQQGEQRIDAFEARVDGTRREHRLQLRLDTPLRPPAWTEALLGPTSGGMRATLDGQGQWQREAAGGSIWRAQQMSLRVAARQGSNGAPWLDARSLQGQLALDAQGRPRRAELAPGRVALPAGAALRWSEASWRAAERGASDRFDLRGELEPLAVAPLLARMQPEIGWTGDLTLAGRFEAHAAEKFDADVTLERAGGDLRIVDETGLQTPLGLSDLRLVFAAHDGLWQFAQGVAGQQLGEMAGSQVMRTDARARWPAPDAPLEGVLQMRVANLGAWGVWVPPGWRLGGNLQVSGLLGGRFGAPEVRGSLRGSDLSVRNALQGVGLADGELSATLEGAVARVQRFQFKGGDGLLRVTGEATLGESPSARLQLEAERFRLLGRIDRRIVTSGRASLDFTRDALRLDGRFTIDEGLIDFSRGGAPTLDADVHVTRNGNARNGAGAARPARPLPATLREAQITLALDLGEKLQVRGRGLDAGLRGELKLTTPGGQLAVNGSVRTTSGTYVAYAQKMSIERGELVFSGSAENPRLDIIAIRPNLDVRVGVAVTGTLANPRVRLFSEPEMAEMDKLSWLVLGRASEGLGRTDTALLQRAAIALLSGEGQGPTDQLLNQLGLSEFSLRQSEGEVKETIVSLGRQLSQRWYVGYERSVNATTGTWQLIYRVAQRFTLRAQSGVENSLDVIWSWRWN